MKNGNRVTLIEKDANLLYGLKARLSSLGFLVESESGHKDLLHIFQTITSLMPDYVIMGSKFTDFNSLDLIHKLKADQQTDKIMIFLIIDDQETITKNKERMYYQAGADYISINRGNFYDNFSETFKKVISNLAKTKI